jgi:DNA-binding response OmpR family regulator
MSSTIGTLDWDSDEEDTRPHRGRVSGARVLVVDDDESTRDLVTAVLHAEGYEVHEAISGTDLLRLLQSITRDAFPCDAVDLILIDLRMLDRTGIEVACQLRAARWDVPMILMTSGPDEDLRRQAALLGMPVLSKPFSGQELAAVTEAGVSGALVVERPSSKRTP